MSGVGMSNATPLAIRFASAAGVSLKDVTGSGPQGRILRRDVASLLAPGRLEAEEALGGEPFKLAAEHEPVRIPGRAATFPLSVEVEIDALIALRDHLNRAAPPAEQLSLSHLIVKAAAVATGLTSRANAALGWPSSGAVDIALIMTLDTGSAAPVIRAADQKGLNRIAREARDLVERAQARELERDDSEGAILSVASFELAADEAVPRIIAPLADRWLVVGYPQMRPVAKGNAVVAATLSSVSLARHDGDAGVTDVRWLQMFKAILEEPLALLL